MTTTMKTLLAFNFTSVAQKYPNRSARQFTDKEIKKKIFNKKREGKKST